MITCKKCGKSFSNYIKINGILKNVSKRKYCLDCSAFGNHNTKKLELINNDPTKVSTTQVCTLCKCEKNKSEFYKKANGERLSCYCKQCIIQNNTKRLREFKLKCLEYKGNKCELCNYAKCIGALEFHHINPAEKEFGIAHRNNSIFDDLVKKELDKCQLLCSNCHREIHNHNL